MYMSRMLEIGKAENGFVVECRVPFKPKKGKGDVGMPMCCCSGSDKQYIAKDAKEVGELVEKLMPLLETEYSDTKAFDAAFKSAVDTEDEMDMEDD
jgi:hypothetical protein